MDAGIYLPILALFTLGLAVVFALLSFRASRKRRKNYGARPGTHGAGG